MAIKALTGPPMPQGMGKLAISFALLAPGLFGGSDDDAIRNTFIKPWIEALRSNDRAKTESFIHPAVLACINPSTKDFWDYVLDHQTHAAPAGVYRIAKLAPMQGPPPTFFREDDATDPVRPTYEITLRETSQWSECLECPIL
jgi:hypothetical protein